jgi:hypothetical protein
VGGATIDALGRREESVVVGRTKLIRTTRSPLISGKFRRPRKVWPWAAAGVVVVVICIALWYAFLR